jgi:fucose 4-O-acetylase-like acetyltransferase
MPRGGGQSDQRGQTRRAAAVARAIAILLVVYGHALSLFIIGRPVGASVFVQAQLISAFAMPLFFTVSGAVFRAKSARDLVSTTLMLLLIADVLHLLGWLINAALGFEGTSLRTLIGPLVRNTDHAFPVVWYLVALAFTQMLYQGLVKGTLIQKALVVALVLGAFVFAAVTGRNDWQAGALLPGMVFFAFGNWLFRRPRVAHDAARAVLSVLAFAALAVLAPLNQGCTFSLTRSCPLPWYEGPFTVWMPNGNIGNVPLFFVTALMGCLGVFWLAELLIRRGGAVEVWMTRLGGRTLDFILFNGFVLAYLQAFLFRLVPNGTPLLPAVAISLGLTVGQVILLPYTLPATRPFIKHMHELARGIVRDARARRLWAFMKTHLRRYATPTSPSAP